MINSETQTLIILSNSCIQTDNKKLADQKNQTTERQRMDSFDPCLALGTSARVDSFTQTQPLLLIDTDLDVHPFRAQHTSIISGSDSHHNMSFNEEANN